MALAYILSLDVDKPDVGTEDQRTKRAKAAMAVVKAFKNGAFVSVKPGTGDGVKKMRELAEKALAGERSLDVQKLLKELLDQMT